jgi:hypothetical protein
MKLMVLGEEGVYVYASPIAVRNFEPVLYFGKIKFTCFISDITAQRDVLDSQRCR